MTRVSHLQLKPDGGTQNTGVIRCLLPEVVYTCSPREPARTSLDSLLFWVLSGILQRSQLGPQRHKLHLSQIMNITHKRNSHSALKTHVSEIVLKNLISCWRKVQVRTEQKSCLLHFGPQLSELEGKKEQARIQNVPTRGHHAQGAKWSL